MKRPLVDVELPGLKSLVDKQFSDSLDSDLFDNVKLPWPELLNGLLQHKRSHNVADVYELPGDHENEVMEDISSNELVSTATEIGRVIEEWVESKIPPHQTNSRAAVDIDQINGDASQRSARFGLRCFGMVHETSARLIGDMQYLNTRLLALSPEENTFSVRVRLVDHVAFLVTEDGTQVGQLNEEMTETLNQLSGLTSLVFEAFANVKSTLQCLHRARRSHDAVIKIDINAYGEASDRDELSRTLSARRTYLQHTPHRKDDFEYDNPHMIAFDEADLVEDEIFSGPEHTSQMRPTTIDEVIADVRQAETRDRGLNGLKHNVQLKANLLHHQEQALEFMVQREVGPIPEEFRLWQQVSDETRTGFQHNITGSWTTTTPSEIGCGILADDMGMGKTLSTLSLISQRLVDGLEWSKSPSTDDATQKKDHTRSRATLVVVSSVLIMNGWYKEIEDHLDSALKIVKHHGKHRHNHLSKITDCDVVFTTYHTLAAERKTKRSPLKSIEWFRIVLDEAHTIRRRSTTLFSAVSELESCHRWCLTGTPIQNTLFDLGSLLVFLRLAPFDKASMFRKHIDAPFSEDLDTATKNLKTLLDSVCLRRSIERLHLPPMDKQTCYVDFTTDERRHYDYTLDTMVRAAAYSSRERFSDTPFGKFQIQLQARIVCNHGTFQRPFRQGRSDVQAQKEDAISSLGGSSEIQCSCCGQPTPVIRTNCAVDSESQLPYQIRCDECMIQLSAEAPQEAAKDKLPTKHSSPPRANVQQSKSLDVSSERGFDLNGNSTKIERLLKDVQVDLLSTKSIVFSCWTRSLNLVAWHLDRHDICYARIDGDTEISQRQKTLDSFAVDENIRVLLMTTGTGAYGLNLAVANRVFILEPQWNPSIEYQAIARVQRFLQTQSVRVVRYIVRATVEEDILRQQIGKEVLAEKGFQAVAPQ